MTTTDLIIAINVIFAVVACTQLLRSPDGLDRKSRHARARSQVRKFDARARIVDIGSQSFAAQARLAIRVAPVELPGTAIELTGSDDNVLHRISVDDVEELRVWLRGRLVPVVCNDAGASASALRPLSSNMAGWELELTTGSADLVRCYGGELDATVEQDFARLRTMLAVRVRSEVDARRPAAVAVRSLGARKWRPAAL
jgi:hypothetical protein